MCLVTTSKQYRAGKTKEVELPSVLEDGGHPVFVIRKVPTKILIKLLSALDVKITPDVEAAQLEGQVKEKLKDVDLGKLTADFLAEIIPVCVVEPKISLDENDKDAIFIDDLDPEDGLALFDEIFKFQGLTEEAAKERSFHSE